LMQMKNFDVDSDRRRTVRYVLYLSVLGFVVLILDWIWFVSK
jgi:hypothetical protein